MTGSCCFEAYTGVEYREEAGGRAVMWSLWRRLVSEMYEQSSERETNANSALQQYSQQPGTGMCEAWQRRMALALVRGKTATGCCYMDNFTPVAAMHRAVPASQ